jgi:hypothetical protein
MDFIVMVYKIDPRRKHSKRVLVRKIAYRGESSTTMHEETIYLSRYEYKKKDGFIVDFFPVA